MNSITPPPMGGGNGKYAVVAILLLGGMVGLWFWRSSGDKPQTIVIHAPDANAPTQVRNNIDDDVPPPPPIIDAGPDTGTRMMSSSGGTGPVCNAAKCNGVTAGDLESALAFRAKQAHACYDSALANDSTLKGKITISVRLASNGQVCSASVASNDMGSPAVAQCVANKFRQTGQFPAPKGGCADINVPVNFVPGGK